jgi:hypothetical protein
MFTDLEKQILEVFEEILVYKEFIFDEFDAIEMYDWLVAEQPKFPYTPEEVEKAMEHLTALGVLTAEQPKKEWTYRFSTPEELIRIKNERNQSENSKESRNGA